MDYWIRKLGEYGMKSHLHLKNCLLLAFTVLTLCFFTSSVSADQANSNNSSQSTSITGGSSSLTDNGSSAKSAPEPGSAQTPKQSTDVTNGSTNDSISTETPSNSKAVQAASSSKAETAVSASTKDDDQDSGQVAVATIANGNDSTVINGQNASSSTTKAKVGKSVKLTTPTKAKDIVSEGSLDAALLPQTGNTAMDFLFYGGVTSLIFIPAAAIFNIFFK
jgi:hypothetical protein